MWKHDQLDSVQLGLLEKGIVEIAGDVDADMARYIREATMRLQALGSPEVNLQITSAGGIVDYGLDIYDLLRLYPGKVVGTVVGVADSITSVILQACAVRRCARHASVTIHHISVRKIQLDELRGAKKLKRFVDDMEKTQARIDAILAGRTKKSKAAIRRQCAKDKAMTAEEALAFGLIDEII